MKTVLVIPFSSLWSPLFQFFKHKGEASMISLPLRLPISNLCLHDGSNHTSLVACLFGAYLEPHGFWVHFIVFGRHSVIAYWCIIADFNGGYFPVTFMAFRRILLKLIALLSKLLLLIVFWLGRCCLSDSPLIFSSDRATVISNFSFLIFGRGKKIKSY